MRVNHDVVTNAASSPDHRVRPDCRSIPEFDIFTENGIRSDVRGAPQSNGCRNDCCWVNTGFGSNRFIQVGEHSLQRLMWVPYDDGRTPTGNRFQPGGCNKDHSGSRGLKIGEVPGTRNERQCLGGGIVERRHALHWTRRITTQLTSYERRDLPG
jgi:hypothetical protein